MEARVQAACVLIGLFSAIAFFDGVYYHLWKFKLFTRKESVVEHLTHTLHALLFGPIVYLLFARNFGGKLLWAVGAIVLVDLAIESWDILIEKSSRDTLGGLPSFEYLCHALAITTRTAAIALIASAKPAAAWALSAPLELPAAYPSIAPLTAQLIVPGALALGLLHVWLLHPRYRRTVAPA